MDLFVEKKGLNTASQVVHHPALMINGEQWNLLALEDGCVFHQQRAKLTLCGPVVMDEPFVRRYESALYLESRETPVTLYRGVYKAIYLVVTCGSHVYLCKVFACKTTSVGVNGDGQVRLDVDVLCYWSHEKVDHFPFGVKGLSEVQNAVAVAVEAFPPSITSGVVLHCPAASAIHLEDSFLLAPGTSMYFEGRRVGSEPGLELDFSNFSPKSSAETKEWMRNMAILGFRRSRDSTPQVRHIEARNASSKNIASKAPEEPSSSISVTEESKLVNELFDVIEYALTLAERSSDSKVSEVEVSASAVVKRSLDSTVEVDPDSTATENEDSEEEELRRKKKRRKKKQKSTAASLLSRCTPAATSKSARRAQRKRPKVASGASDKNSVSQHSSANSGLWKIEQVFARDIIIDEQGVEDVLVAWCPTECDSKKEALDLCDKWPDSHKSIYYHKSLKKWFVNWKNSYRPSEKIVDISSTI